MVGSEQATRGFSIQGAISSSQADWSKSLIVGVKKSLLLRFIISSWNTTLFLPRIPSPSHSTLPRWRSSRERILPKTLSHRFTSLPSLPENSLGAKRHSLTLSIILAISNSLEFRGRGGMPVIWQINLSLVNSTFQLSNAILPVLVCVTILYFSACCISQIWSIVFLQSS